MLGICNGYQSQICLTSDNQRFGGLWIQLGGVRGELNFLPKVRSVKRVFELLPRPHRRLVFPIGFDGEHPDASGLLLEFSKLGTQMLVFLLKLAKMSGHLSFRLKTTNRICEILKVYTGTDADEEHRPVVLERSPRVEDLGFRHGCCDRTDF